jgi:hypothetical protein
MFRKHFRFRRLVIGLAFAALAVPVTPALGASLTFVDGGPMPVSVAPVTTAPPAYLRYHQAGVPATAGAPAVSSSDGFNWTAVGIGASSVFGAVLLLGLAVAITRRNQHTGLTRA